MLHDPRKDRWPLCAGTQLPYDPLALLRDGRELVASFRDNGSLIGAVVTPTTLSAPGVWSMDAVRRSQLAGIWPKTSAQVEYLVIGGGGAGGGSFRGGGAGAGGYRTNVPGDLSGGGAAAEAAYPILLETAYSVIVGAGGTPVSIQNGNPGASSTFDTIVSLGGGGGGKYQTSAPTGSLGSGGGGGGGSATTGAAGTSGQGTSGAGGSNSESTQSGGGGGGASNSGVAGGGTATSGDGGAGLSSTITGTPTTRAGGGGSGAYGGGNPSEGGAGGGGRGGSGSSPYENGVAGTANTGGGGGGSSGNSSSGIGGAGGSGVVILRVPDNITATFSAGVTSSHSAITGYNVYTITATATAEETVTFH